MAGRPQVGGGVPRNKVAALGSRVGCEGVVEFRGFPPKGRVVGLLTFLPVVATSSFCQQPWREGGRIANLLAGPGISTEPPDYHDPFPWRKRQLRRVPSVALCPMDVPHPGSAPKLPCCFPTHQQWGGSTGGQWNSREEAGGAAGDPGGQGQPPLPPSTDREGAAASVAHSWTPGA